MHRSHRIRHLLRNRKFGIDFYVNCRCLRTQCVALLPRGCQNYERKLVEKKGEEETLPETERPKKNEVSRKVHKDTRSIDSIDPVILKYTNIFNELRNVKNNNEKIYSTNFGSIRFDKENVPKVHGQYDDMYGPAVDVLIQERLSNAGIKFNQTQDIGDEVENYSVQKNELYLPHSSLTSSQQAADIDKKSDQSTSSSEPGDVDCSNNIGNYIDDLYFAAATEKCSQTSLDSESTGAGHIRSTTSKAGNTDLNYIDDCVFGASVSKNNGSDHSTASIQAQRPAITSDVNDNPHNLNYIDNVFFGGAFDTLSENRKPTVEFKKIKEDLEISLFGEINTKEKGDDVVVKEEEDENFNFVSSPSLESRMNIAPVTLPHLTHNSKEKEELQNNLMKQTKKAKPKPQDVETTPKSAFEYVVKQRKEQHLKEHGVNVEEGSGKKKSYKKVLSLLNDKRKDSFTKYEVFNLLKNSIIYDNYDIIGLYKPYGMVMHQGTSSHHHVLSEYLPDLAIHLKSNELYPIHRLDANTSGVLLLSRTPAMADTLKRMFKERQLKKTYWAITKGIPNPLQGVVDIPVAEGLIEERRRMVLAPVIKGVKGPTTTSHEAITSFKVLARCNSTALVELSPTTGVKHQLRVHLGFGMGCPVLGDHKYSHLRKMAPQRLPGDALHRLKINQSKVRNLPLFLHCRSVLIPEIVDGRNIFIKAKLPAFFNKTLSLLKLNRHQSIVKYED
ncbi:uncharacterized protein LOC121876093 [Homarus americanus]|uniref:Pseudouridylate synthase RPUSD4, mitochondrial n=1 Tax=Homarus americanus TaxID=6706 RepID=A0A8J5MRD5_HOMAM|nr:uncharacterized protein LOC121876093 [Homarus americanus]KAG7160522.1 Mitochondrial RNA pseudouridine synthase Rpusd4-like 1 [Homarus americanus]